MPHAAYLKQAAEDGIVILAGRSQGGAGPAIVVIEVEDEQDEVMIRLSLASHWQTSRIYSILGQADNARRYGQLCLEASQGDDVGPFFLGYTHEARAEAARSRAKMEESQLGALTCRIC